MNTDWLLIGQAVEYYKNVGYKYVEAPWKVSFTASSSTHECEPNRITSPYPELNADNCLVGSAEQSFVQLMLDAKIGPGAYVAVTPCFRNDTEDELHVPYFMKVELIHILDNQRSERPDAYLTMCVNSAWSFFYDTLKKNVTKIVPTDDGVDIQLNGIEIGTYGIKRYGEFTWVCGTGVAEPRFSIARSKL